MSELTITQDDLERECDVYCRYLVHQSPSSYVLEKYFDCSRQFEDLTELPTSRFDRRLLATSRRSPLSARLVDCYVSHFYKRSVVRRKQILLLAILECAPPSFEYIDAVDRGGRAVVFLKLSGKVVLYAVTLLASVCRFGPLHAFSALSDQDARKEPS